MDFLEIIYCLAIIILTSFLLVKLKILKLEGIGKVWVLAAFYVKIISGIILFFIYTNYYDSRKEADIYRYFDDSKIMYDALSENPKDFFAMVSGIGDKTEYFKDKYYAEMDNWYQQYPTVVYDDTHTIIRINALLRIFSSGYFFVHLLVFIIMAFLGFIALYKTFVRYFAKNKGYLFFALFFIPSVVFWSSGILKESFLFFALGLFIYSYQQLIYNTINYKYILCFIIGLFCLFHVKTYVLAAFIPLIIANFWIVRSNNKRAFLKYIIVLLAFLGFAVLLAAVNNEYDVFALLSRKMKDFKNIAILSNAGSMIEPISLKPTLWSFIQNTPTAIFNVLFRPLPSDISSLIILPAFLENILIVLTIITAIFFHVKKIKHERVFWFCIFFALILAAIIGLSTPVLGAIVRYRTPFLPFLFIALFLIIDFNKVLKFLKIKKTI